MWPEPGTGTNPGYNDASSFALRQPTDSGEAANNGMQDIAARARQTLMPDVGGASQAEILKK